MAAIQGGVREHQMPVPQHNNIQVGKIITVASCIFATIALCVLLPYPANIIAGIAGTGITYIVLVRDTNTIRRPRSGNLVRAIPYFFYRIPQYINLQAINRCVSVVAPRLAAGARARVG